MMKLAFIFTTLSEVENKVNLTKELFFDTETEGFYGRVCLAQFMQEGWEEALLVQKPNQEELAKLVSKCITVCHNIHYDASTLQDQVKSFRLGEFEDTFLLARLALPKLDKFSLDSVLEHCLGFDPYVKLGLKKSELQKTRWANSAYTEKQKQYAAVDVFYMPAVWDKVKAAKETQSYELDKATVLACLETQRNGLPLHKENIAKHVADSRQVLADHDWLTINVNSYKQVREFLGSESSDDAYLSEREFDGCEKAKAIRTVRKHTKRLSYLTKLQSFGDTIYGKIKPSAKSGRTTSDNENLQQIPRALKDCIGGKTIIFADYAQLELRTICAILCERTMEKLFREGKDLHAFTAEMLFGRAWTDLHRLYSKGANFGLLYGGGVEMFVGFMMQIASVRLSLVEANKIRAKWRNLWTTIYKWQQVGIAKWQAGKLGSTPLGRPYKAKMMTDYLNLENQGAGAEVAKLALVRLVREIAALREKHNLAENELYVGNFVHDSYLVIYSGSDLEIVAEAAATLGRVMQQAWFDMSVLYKIKDLPMPVSVRAAYDWKSADSDKGEKIFELDIEGMEYYNA